MSRSGMLLISITVLLTLALSINVCAQVIDGTAPEITYILPEDGQKDVSITSRIAIQFSENMDEESVEQSFSIEPEIEIFEYYWDSMDFMSVTFYDWLMVNTTYTVRIDTSAKDISDEYLEEVYEFSFTTEGNYIGDEDLDYDDLPDAWEYEFFETTMYDGFMDYDNDGYSNIDEYQEETDPTDPESHPEGGMNLTIVVMMISIAVIVAIGIWFMRSEK